MYDLFLFLKMLINFNSILIFDILSAALSTVVTSVQNLDLDPDLVAKLPKTVSELLNKAIGLLSGDNLNILEVLSDVITLVQEALDIVQDTVPALTPLIFVLQALLTVLNLLLLLAQLTSPGSSGLLSLLALVKIILRLIVAAIQLG